MKIQQQAVTAKGIKFTIEEDGETVARAYLYPMHNELHEQPFGLLEDVFIKENQRGKRLGTKIVNQVIASAKKEGCYKLIATSRSSREQVHQMYRRL